MPFYEFECPDGHVTEVLVPMGSKTVVCEQCSKDAGRIMSATKTDFHFNDLKRGRKKLLGPPPRSLGKRR